MNRNALKILIADDHPLLIKGMENVLNSLDVVSSVLTAADGAEALGLLEKHCPDIAILDIEMPVYTGIQVARKIKERQLPVKIIFLTLHKERSLFEEARKIGISGYVLKEFSVDEIERCVRAIVAGKTFISPKLEEILEGGGQIDLSMLSKTEKNVIRLIARNKTTKEIAEMLFLSPKTVENNRYNICKKLELPAEKNSLFKWVFEHKKILDNL